jgi:hypothetical protein
VVAPFVHCTTEQGRMFPPVTVKVTEVVPAIAATGEAEMFVGAGSSEGEIVKGVRFDGTPELETRIFTIPAEIRSEIGMMALSCVGLTNVVARDVVIAGTDPVAGITQSTAEPATKFAPVTVRATCEGLHDAAAAEEVVEAETFVIEGGMIENGTGAGQFTDCVGTQGVMLKAVRFAV